ncbi:histone family protein [Candidatus Woesearchaeota archaeon]|nr:histone family protein [Candidatus Woesearchaeota archaeon]
MSISKSSRLLPLATMENLMLEAGAERVSEDAKKELKSILEGYATDIAEKSIKYAKHAGRKTIKSEDIKLALKN